MLKDFSVKRIAILGDGNGAHAMAADLALKGYEVNMCRAVGTKALCEAFDKYGLRDYLMDIEERLRKGKHHGIEFYYNRKKNIRVMYCKHANTLGIQNRRHAIRNGAMRRHELEEPEIEVIVDGQPQLWAHRGRLLPMVNI